MVINPFWAGVISTLWVQTAVFVGLLIYAGIKNKKGDNNNGED